MLKKTLLIIILFIMISPNFKLNCQESNSTNNTEASNNKEPSNAETSTYVSENIFGKAEEYQKPNAACKLLLRLKILSTRVIIKLLMESLDIYDKMHDKIYRLIYKDKLEDTELL